MSDKNKIGFFYFGSKETGKKINYALQQNSLVLVEKQNGFGQMKIDEKKFGSIFANNDYDFTCFFAYEEEDVKKGIFPNKFKKHSVSFKINNKNGNSIKLFEEFVAFVRQFESYLKAYLNKKEEACILPQGFYGILQYEFFKEIIEHTNNIELSFAEPESFGNVKAIVTMIHVLGTDHNDSLEFSDLVFHNE